jgi:hypothetical protein
VLGGSLVFMITFESRYETLLKDTTGFFFRILFSYFQPPRQAFKNLQKINLLRFQSADSPTFDTSQFSKLVFAYQLLEILLFQK